MHVVSQVRAACWRLEPCPGAACDPAAVDATVVPLRPAPPPLVLVQRWIFGRVEPAHLGPRTRRDPHRPAPHLHPVG